MTVIYKKMTQTQMIVVGYLLLILLGSILLMLPVSSRDGNMTSFADALFTSTSASCVTGLVVQDTYLHWSFFGQDVYKRQGQGIRVCIKAKYWLGRL